jgi:hypothetical protein
LIPATLIDHRDYFSSDRHRVSRRIGNDSKSRGARL